AIVPAIVGSDLNGNAFNENVFKKINVVICWMSYNNLIRKNHPLFNELYIKYKDKGVEFIGVSMDKEKRYWKTVVKKDGLKWPQYSDLLGAKSPNARLSDFNIPYIFIIDGNRKILSNDVQPQSLEFELKELTKK
ncbi:MAG: redoxin domain-containing protein, partial [Pedobacter sp.]